MIFSLTSPKFNATVTVLTPPLSKTINHIYSTCESAMYNVQSQNPFQVLQKYGPLSEKSIKES